MKIKKKRLLLIFFLIILLLGFIYFIKKPSKVGNFSQIETKKSELTFTYDLSGIVESKNTVTVFAPTISEVRNVNFKVGESVKKDDVLITLKKDSTNQDGLKIQSANINIDSKRRDYEAIKKVYEVGGASYQQVLQAKDAYSQAVIDRNIQSNTSKEFVPEIKSPISGVVLEVNADTNFLVDQSKPLMKIVDIEKLQIVAELPNAKARNIKEGQVVKVTSESLDKNEVLEGKVTAISKISTKSSYGNENITKIYIELSDYKNLKPGDYTNIQVIYNKVSNAIILPIEYILFENNKNYVFVNENGVAHKKEVTLGLNDGINYEIKSGLNEKQVVISNLNGLLKEGDKIK